MTRMPRASAALSLTLFLVAVSSPAPASAARFHGKSVDGPRFHGSIINHDFGSFDDLEFRFQGETAYVYFPTGGRMVLILEDEEIANPRAISAHDPRRGIMWEIDVIDMGAR